MKKCFKKLIIIPGMLSFFCVSSPVSLVADNYKCVHKVQNVKTIVLGSKQSIENNSLAGRICRTCLRILAECVCGSAVDDAYEAIKEKVKKKRDKK